MILQTSPRLDRHIKKNGCYFMSILYLSSQKNCQSFGIEDILRLKKESIRKGFLREDVYVLNPEGIFYLAGLPVRYANRHDSPTYQAANDELEIQYYRWGEYGHFVAALNGRLVYDPMGMSNSVKLGSLRSKRIFKIL